MFNYNTKFLLFKENVKYCSIAEFLSSNLFKFQSLGLIKISVVRELRTFNINVFWRLIHKIFYFKVVWGLIHRTLNLILKDSESHAHNTLF